jgi:hypothetical protein
MAELEVTPIFSVERRSAMPFMPLASARVNLIFNLFVPA